MNITEEDYRIWENDKFIVESNIDVNLWDKKIIESFQEDLSKILDLIQLGFFFIGLCGLLTFSGCLGLFICFN